MTHKYIQKNAIPRKGHQRLQDNTDRVPIIPTKICTGNANNNVTKQRRFYVRMLSIFNPLPGKKHFLDDAP
jgi:hypothetical protein